MITTVKQLDDYINWLTAQKVIATYAGGSPEFSADMRRLMDAFTHAGKLLQTGGSEQAISRYSELLDRHPGFVAARYNLAHTLKGMGRYEEALQQYTIAAQYNPNDPALYIELGDVYYRLDRKGEEIMAYFQALVLAPQQDVETIWHAFKNIGQTFGEVGEYGKSLKFLQMALDTASENSRVAMTAHSWDNEFSATYLEIGNTYKYMRNYGKAEEMYLKGVKVGADAPSAASNLRHHETMLWNALTDLYLELGQWSKAEQYARKCFERYPGEQRFLRKLREAQAKGRQT